MPRAPRTQTNKPDAAARFAIRAHAPGAPSVPRMHPGEVVEDRFEIEGPVAVGGMGQVFRALDRRSGEPVALKVALGEDAIAQGTWLLDDARAFSDPGRERWARTVLAYAYLLRGDLDAAEGEALAFLAMGQPTRFEHAEALATLAAIRLAQGRVPEALAASREAIGRIEAGRGRALRDPFLRLVHVNALTAAGERAAADAALATARDRLLEVASWIPDAALRRSFLEDMPDNARTLELARERLGEVGGPVASRPRD